jgi:hypothetical protein
MVLSIDHDTIFLVVKTWKSLGGSQMSSINVLYYGAVGAIGMCRRPEELNKKRRGIE